MQDMLWFMAQKSRVLQELRKEVGGVWKDEAARELTQRYLDPHEEDDQQMLVGFEAQYKFLVQHVDKLDSAEYSARQAEEYSVLAAEGLNASEQELQTAYGNYDTYIHYDFEARSRLPVIQNLISQANNACNG